MLIHALLTLVPGSLLPGDWTALPLPSLCDPVASRSFARLDEGTHLHLTDRRDERSADQAPELTPNDVGALLEASARAADVDLERFPYAPPLLVRGTQEQLDWARAEVAALNRASQRNRIQLVVLLSKGELDEAQARELMRTPSDQPLDPQHRIWRRDVLPGTEVAFGERTQARFLADYEVNVATDSGVAAPRIGSAYTGTTLHLTGSRVELGAGVFLRGWLDLSELSDSEVFDPGSPDLGQVEQPILSSLSLGFSGVVRGAELLRIEVEGAPLASPDWTVHIGAQTDREPTAPGPQDWIALDLSLVTQEGSSYGAFHPGAGLQEAAQLSALRAHFEPLSAIGVLSASEPRRRSSSSGAGATRAASHVGERTLLLSSAWWEQNADEGLTSMLEALEAPRLRTERLELSDGTLRVAFPVTAGEPARLIAGKERTLLTGYHADIAPNTWMPAPIIERLFDGIAWQGREESDGFRSSAWRSETRSLEARTRHEANMGALQLAQREVEDGAALLSAASSTTVLAGRPGTSPLRLRRE